MYTNMGCYKNCAVVYKENMRNLKYLRDIRFGGVVSHLHNHENVHSHNILTGKRETELE